MSGFAALMALSASQTKASQNAVQSVLQQRQRNEELRLRQQEERELKQRELEQRMRLKHFEDQKREQERQQRLKKEAEERERLLQRREEQQRDALRYGPKKAKSAAGSSATSINDDDIAGPRPNTGSRNRRHKDNSDNSNALTREEKRERKMLSEFKVKRRAAPAAKRRAAKPSTSSRTTYGRRLPGGAIDVTVSPGTIINVDPNVQYRSVKERIAAQPNVLMKLNVVKRDTRTIDEIVRDRAKAREAKILSGDDAREFSDWFGKGRKEKAKQVSASSTPMLTSRANTPNSVQPASSKSSTSVTPLTKPPATKTAIQASSSKQPASSMYPKTMAQSSTIAVKSSTSNGPTSAYSVKPKPTHGGPSAVNGHSTTLKKRPRSPSVSDSSPPPAKRRASAPTDSQGDIRAEIWKMFGKDRMRYVQRDVFSDDDDMEAGASVLEKEEMRSARIAVKEDHEALEEERRHEEEKRRRRKEKERRV